MLGEPPSAFSTISLPAPAFSGEGTFFSSPFMLPADFLCQPGTPANTGDFAAAGERSVIRAGLGAAAIAASIWLRQDVGDVDVIPKEFKVWFLVPFATFFSELSSWLARAAGLEPRTLRHSTPGNKLPDSGCASGQSSWSSPRSS